jgi:Domain of unknown function (DUF4386)
MSTIPIDISQRKAARVAGIASLVTMFLIVVSNFGITERLIVAGNAAETARNILAHQTLFRVGIASELVYATGVIVLLTALFVILKPVSRGVALLGAFFRLVYASMWIVIALNSFFALRILVGADYLRVFEADQLQAWARLYQGSSFDVYYVGLLFYALASTVCSYLWLKSRYVPKVLVAFGFVSSIWCVACTLAFIISPGFAKTVNLWWFDSPMAIFELALSLWLLIVGLRQSGTLEVSPPAIR